MDAVQVRIRLARLRISQERLARAAKIDPSAISRYLRGDRKPSDKAVARIEAALDRLERAERAADEARRRVLAS